MGEGSSAHTNGMALHIDSYSNIRAPNLQGVLVNISLAGHHLPRAITSLLSLLSFVFSEPKAQLHKEQLLWLDWRELGYPLLSVSLLLTLPSCVSSLTPLLLGTAPPFLIFHLSNISSDSSPLPFAVSFLPHLFPPQLSAAGQGTIDYLLAYFM